MSHEKLLQERSTVVKLLATVSSEIEKILNTLRAADEMIKFIRSLKSDKEFDNLYENDLVDDPFGCLVYIDDVEPIKSGIESCHRVKLFEAERLPLLLRSQSSLEVELSRLADDLVNESGVKIALDI
mmetsp:Transcript_14604/g.17052  ORF Transcript_14604/g.17052 Transcript_14604/m.17052 type:complete len:127 (-) Transcript_14604:933-1313(-)|eukprot:CAMPEP_0184018836 /NCGR_PEP_ID=MMETSP0954-20121128/8387_1 /TAXON_ID=627963 /ORGANISM="Aplanochytrium sp, Strain PBS07" /LENGTH=126 /DNA_ID=CAMNT_0026300375 /DNA_START=325 /DNA_END=705 /DNA_ORIENTATION=-